jgi:parvulin-like peptidyl-prolyl isomerase
MRELERAFMLGVFIAFAAHSQVAAQLFGSKPKVAATVNGEPITLDDVDALLKRVSAPAALDAAHLRARRLDALEGLIDELLVRQFLRQHGPKIDAAEVDQAYAALEAAQKTHARTMADYLKESGLSEAQARENIRALLQMARYVQDNTTEAALRKYYDENKDFFDQSAIRVSQIVLRVGRLAPAQERRAAREKLEAVRAQIAAGKIDFAAAAKAHSHCPSAAQGGDLGFISRKWQVDEPIARAAFALQIGELSGVVDSEVGLHLLKVTERRTGPGSTFEMSVEEVRACYAEELRLTLAAKLRAQAKIEVTVP